MSVPPLMIARIADDLIKQIDFRESRILKGMFFALGALDNIFKTIVSINPFIPQIFKSRLFF
jgi:hypothetical protein